MHVFITAVDPNLEEEKKRVSGGEKREKTGKKNDRRGMITTSKHSDSRGRG